MHEKLQKGEPLPLYDIEEVEVQDAPDLFDPKQMNDPLDFSSGLEGIKSGRHFSNARKYALASLFFFGILLIAPFIYLLLTPIKQVQSAGLFHQYFKALPLGENDQKCTDFKSGEAQNACRSFVVNYTDGKHEDAFKQLTNLLATEPENAAELHLYTANSLLATGKTTEALLHLKRPELLNGDHRHKALWYIALAQLNSEIWRKAEKLSNNCTMKTPPLIVPKALG